MIEVYCPQQFLVKLIPFDDFGKAPCLPSQPETVTPNNVVHMCVTIYNIWIKGVAEDFNELVHAKCFGMANKVFENSVGVRSDNLTGLTVLFVQL